jgi:hypothetical protein
VITRDTVRRWIIDEGLTDEQIGTIVQQAVDEAQRATVWTWIDETRATSKWWTEVAAAYREAGYRPTMEDVADRLNRPVKRFRIEVHDHGIGDWRDMHVRLGR